MDNPLNHKEFSVEYPDTIGKRYVMLESAGVNGGRKLYFTPSDARYWVASDRPCPEEVMAEYLPYLSWSFDEIDEHGINAFPPTTENILKKADELRQEKLAGLSFPTQEDLAKVMKEIQIAITPVLLDHEDSRKVSDKYYGKSKLDSILRTIERDINS